MKAIFLDIDGVLNDENILLEKQEENQIEISKEKLLLLKEIITKTNSKIILSSSWRNGLKKEKKTISGATNFHKEFLKLLKKYDITIYDITGSPKGKRIEEILEYLKNNKEIENYIILDDESLNSKHQIKTDFENGGLTKKHVKTAINKLNRVRKR